MNGVITTKEAAERLKVSVRRVQALIATGRLPAEKIGKTFAIRESDLKLVNGRKNGRPPEGSAKSQDYYNKILLKYVGCLKGLPSDLSTNKKYLEGLGRD